MAAPAQPMMPPPPPPQQHSMGSPVAPDARPTGVTILSVLNGIIGAFALLGGLMMIAGGGMVAGMAGAEGGVVAALVGVFGFVLLVLGALYLVAAWGLWTRQRWAWYIAMVGAIIGIVNGLVSLPLGIVGLLISGLVGWYLLTPEVQRWFGLSYNVPWNKTATT